MGKITNPNLKPVSAGKEESGASKRSKKRTKEDEAAKLAAQSSKFFKKSVEGKKLCYS